MLTQTRHFLRRTPSHWTTCTALLFCLVIAVPPAHAGLPHHRRQSKAVVEAITSLESKWVSAELQSNVTDMGSMLSEDYLGITPDGTLQTKAEALAAYKNGALHFTRMETSDRKIRVYGTTVVVVSKVDVAGTRNGQDFSGLYCYTRVYHSVGTTWQIVSFEANRIRPH